MRITLPPAFYYKGKEPKRNFARINNKQLFIFGSVNVEDLMYKLTYCLKGNLCFYCNTKLTRSNRTLDHIIPRDLGGPTIPDNLVPCCRACNALKSNLTFEDFLIYRKLENSHERHEFYQICMNKQELIRKEKGFCLPTSWFENIALNEIVVTIMLDALPEARKDELIKDYYAKYHSFKRPILVDKNGYLLDGFKTVMFAKNNNITNLPAIILENVKKEF